MTPLSRALLCMLLLVGAAGAEDAKKPEQKPGPVGHKPVDHKVGERLAHAEAAEKVRLLLGEFGAKAGAIVKFVNDHGGVDGAGKAWTKEGLKAHLDKVFKLAKGPGGDETGPGGDETGPGGDETGPGGDKGPGGDRGLPQIPKANPDGSPTVKGGPGGDEGLEFLEVSREELALITAEVGGSGLAAAVHREIKESLRVELHFLVGDARNDAIVLLKKGPGGDEGPGGDKAKALLTEGLRLTLRRLDNAKLGGGGNRSVVDDAVAKLQDALSTELGWRSDSAAKSRPKGPNAPPEPKKSSDL